MNNKKLTDSKKRKRDYHVRLTLEEFQAVEKKVKKSKLTKQEYGYRALMKKKIIVVEGFPELTKQIRKIGVNVNQVAHLANANKYLREQDVQKLFERLGDIWQLLNNFLSENKAT